MFWYPFLYVCPSSWLWNLSSWHRWGGKYLHSPFVGISETLIWLTTLFPNNLVLLLFWWRQGWDANQIFGVNSLFPKTMSTATFYSPSPSKSMIESSNSLNYCRYHSHSCHSIVLWVCTYGWVPIFPCSQDTWVPTFQRYCCVRGEMCIQNFVCLVKSKLGIDL